MTFQNIKTRIAALGLALVMGLVPAASVSPAYAAGELTGQTETAAQEGNRAGHPVTAEDLTKSAHDRTFSIGTCFEGIRFDPERETVSLSTAIGEDGSEYRPGKAGTYIAAYLVTPKDQSECYVVTRKIILTDTDGLAEVSGNGGEPQKTDPDSGKDSESGKDLDGAEGEAEATDQPDSKRETEEPQNPEAVGNPGETADPESKKDSELNKDADSRRDEESKKDAELKEDPKIKDTEETPRDLPKVRITSTEAGDSEEELSQLKEDMEEGNVMILSAAGDVFRTADSTVNLQKGEDIQYPGYLGNYNTSWFHVNGKVAYCLESQKATPPTGDYVSSVLDSNGNLQKVLYYGYGGAGDLTGEYLPGKSEEERYVYTHLAASYAYAGDAGFAGCTQEALENAGVMDYIDRLFGMEAPPSGELSFSSTSVEAIREGDLQKTPEISLQGDHRNYIELSIPQDVTCYNVSTGTTVTNGEIRIYGTDSFYLTAELNVSGRYDSGSLYGFVGETWRTLVLSTGEGNQDIGVFESQSAEPVRFHVDWQAAGRIGILKKDQDTGNPLAGAVYGIYKDEACTDLLQELPATDASGRASSSYLEGGLARVYVREIQAPPHYLQNGTVYPVDVEAGKDVEVTALDQLAKDSLKIQKTDRENQGFHPQGDGELEGAVYGLYAREDIVHPDGSTGILYEGGSLISQGAIGADGTVTFTDLYPGTMYVKEITPPKGYLLDPTEYDVEVSAGGETETAPLTVSDQVMKQAFQLIKVSEDGEQTETGLVEGAGFTVYLVSSLSKVASGELTPENGSTFTAADFLGYDFSGETPATICQDGEEIPVPEIFTDAKGHAVSPELPYGLYVVEESTVPENLKQVHPFLVEITQDSREPMQWRAFDDRPFGFRFKIVKKDAQTGNTVLKAGTAYQIYDCEKEEYVKQTVQYPKKGKVDVFTTNEDGYLVTPEKLKSSTYRIEEAKAPEGFVRQGNEMSLSEGGNPNAMQTSAGNDSKSTPAEDKESDNAVSADGGEGNENEPPDSGDDSDTNPDDSTYQEAPKGQIEVTVSENTPCQIDPDTGDAIVEVAQANDEQVGSLTLIKTGEQLAGIEKGTIGQPEEKPDPSLLEKAAGLLAKARDAVTGKSSESGAETTMETGITCRMRYEEAAVEGAEFELRAKEPIYSPDGAKDANGEPLIRYQAGDLVATLATDGEGKAVVHDLPLGTYALKETKAGDHFILSQEEKVFTLSAGDDAQAVVYEEVSIHNERQKIQVSAEKRDAVSGEVLEGVVFGLYTAEDILSARGEVLVEKGTLLERQATNASGIAAFESDLCHGKYYVKEEQPLPGYLANTKLWEFHAAYESQMDAVLTFSGTILNQPTESRFTKTDAATGEEVEGAVLQILDKEGTVAEEWTSTREPHVVYGLPEGEYVLHEELAPLEDGYVSAEDIAFEVRADGSVTEVEMKDAYSMADIIKTDLATGKVLPGATLQILGKEGELLEEWVTDGKPHRMEKLPVGVELTLRETTAPEGYEIAEDVRFTLKDTMEVQKVEMQDARTPEKPTAPKTGDSLYLPIVLLTACVGSAAVLAVLVIRRKRAGNREEE